MAEFDDKLNSLLSNPDAMSQIMQLAQSLSGDTQQQSGAPPPPQPPLQAPSGGQTGTQNPFSGNLFSALGGGMDPKLMLKLLPLIQELGGQKDSHVRQLLFALRPYLREERQEKVERALQLARLFHIGKKFLSEWEG